MKVYITVPAKAALRAICDYYKSEGHISYATKLRKAVITKAKSLSTHHKRGKEEELLKPLQKEHRYLLAEKHYKIIYRTEKKMVIVTDVFDTRQQPEKLIKRNQ